jgi:hypothetical protein
MKKLHFNTMSSVGARAVSLAFALLLSVVSVAACGDETVPAANDTLSGSDLADAASPLDQADGSFTIPDALSGDISFVGYECERDDECSTGYCYGASTAQGAFEAKRCQSKCLEINDFRRYCDSDRDCCSGRCCIGCGAKEGLCVLTISGGTGD